MARKKALPIGVEETPKPVGAAPGVDGSLETPSGSFSTSSTNSTCPHCNSVFQDMSPTDFRDHVASCTRPSTANNDDDSSVLSTPPPSPSQLPSSPTEADDGVQEIEDAKEEIAQEDEVRQFNSEVVIEPAEPTVDEQDVDDKLKPKELEEPRPYVNPGVEFVHYEYNQPQAQPQADPQEADSPEANSQEADPQEANSQEADPQETDPQEIDPLDKAQADPQADQADAQADQAKSQAIQADPQADAQVDPQAEPQNVPQGGSDADQTTPNPSQNPPEPTERFPFQKLTDPEVFEKYLEDPEDMTYDELYHRTEVVSKSLVAYQAEWDAIDTEILQYERNQKYEQKLAEEETKAIMEKQRVKDDAERDEVAEEFQGILKLPGTQWQEWLAKNENNIDEETMRHLKNLRNPQFMAAARKAQQAAINRDKRLLNTPWPEVKQTKADLEWEKRQGGRLMDPMKFDDMKQADAYGFEYSAHAKHRGDQPLKEVRRPVNLNSNPTSNPSGDDPNNGNRGRTQRKATRKVYEADASATPEESPEEDGQKLPLKRSRKPKIFIDGVETTERSRGQSRSGTPAVRTFASGKRVGRPPAKSKLQAVQLAQPSQTPEVASGSEALNADGAAQDDALEHQELAPSQEAQLHDAAESLVNQTQTDNLAAPPVVKRKHAGGRPRKIKPEVAADATQVPAREALQPKRKHPGGRPRKHPLPVDVDSENAMDEEPKPKKLKPTPKRRGGRVKKETIPEEDLVQLGEENGVLQSTEQDDGSQYTSTATTRPTTSDSNATVSTFGSRRSARPATRDKTNAREARASAIRRGSTAVQESSSLPTSGRGKRKRASSDTDPSPIIVEPIQVADPPSKKRRNRGKLESDDVIEALPAVVPEASTGRFKRKRGNTINDFIAVAEPATINFAPPPKKRRRGIKVEEKAEPEVEVEEVDSDADIDEELLDPIAREALRKKRVKKEKSRKLSRNMKARWASGGMKEAQETRKANNALKRAHKEQTLANEAAGLPPPPPPVLIGTAPNAGQASTAAPAPEREPEEETPVETPVETPATATPAPAPGPIAAKRKRTKSKSKAIPPKRPASTRARKPTRAAMGFDGADDEDEDEDENEPEFASEYDHFQALTSPRKPMFLGKRQRKSYVDLSQLMNSDDDEFSG